MTDEEATPKAMTKDDIRAGIFGVTHAKKVIPVTFFGVKIELHQPALQDILKAQQADDRESAIIQTLIDYARVPGTEEPVFEKGDIASLKAMPFGADFLRVSQALEDLTEVNFLVKPASSKNGQTST